VIHSWKMTLSMRKSAMWSREVGREKAGEGDGGQVGLETRHVKRDAESIDQHHKHHAKDGTGSDKFPVDWLSQLLSHPQPSERDCAARNTKYTR
jgi:hypothetical protein